MEPDELALSDVHVGTDVQATDMTLRSSVPMIEAETGEGSEAERGGESDEPPGATAVEKISYQIYQTEFVFERESVMDNDDMSEPAEIDTDGDHVLHRKKKELCSIKIEHTMSTRLIDVGHQVWKGCLLLSDFILHHEAEFDNATILELGAGVGLASVVMATVAKKVICTDIGESVLNLCSRNADINRKLFKYDEKGVKQNVVLIRELDWTETNIPITDCGGLYRWSKADGDILNKVSVIIAADVIYSEDLTTDFFKTIVKLMAKPPNKILYLAVERRLNFTLDDLEVSCPAYIHFMNCVKDLCKNETETKFTAEQMKTDFSQRLRYERSPYLVLWKITATSRTKKVT